MMTLTPKMIYNNDKVKRIFAITKTHGVYFQSFRWDLRLLRVLSYGGGDLTRNTLILAKSKRRGYF